MNEYFPDDASPPGATFADLLIERSMSHVEAALRLGWTLEEVQAFLEGSMCLTPEGASDLARVFKTSQHIWLRLEEAYRG